MSENFTIVIPARFGSQRLPGKPLRDIGGGLSFSEPLSQRRSSATNIVVATDDEGVAQTVRQFGGESCMTLATHQSGTDRVAEAARILGLAPTEIIVNVQGDEPDMPGELIDQVATLLSEDSQAMVATACTAWINPSSIPIPPLLNW